MRWQILVGIIAGLALMYVVLAAVLWHAFRRVASPSLLRESLRLLPDLVRPCSVTPTTP